jgi:GNAT superfamily N-acetyltransferase
VIIRRARLDEAATLTQLVFKSKRHWGYDDEFMEQCRSELVVREDDIAAGMVYVAVDGVDDEALGVYVLTMLSDDEAELDMLFVVPSHIGEGVGAALLSNAFDVLRASGRSVVWVESDPFAATFYERAGALLVGTSTSVSTGRELPIYQFRL